MENEKRLLFLAQEVTIAEEDRLDPVFLKIKFKLFDNVGNRNNEGVTAAFISDIVKRKEAFVCLPFYADVKNLLARNYDKLGHMYNRFTKKFGTDQIGSMTDFYSDTDNDGVISLYAEARVPKREYETCVRLVELYEMGQLAVSFEVRYNPEFTIEKDGVVFIDANEDNALTGMALVSVPACVDAVALDMVAEVADDSDIVTECEDQAERGETETMPKVKKITAEVEETMVSEEETINAEAETEQEKDPVAVAEGEGASESGGEGASESGGDGASESGGEGASESGGEGASEGGGEGASEGGGGSGGSGNTSNTTDALTIDPDDEGKANAEAQDANAEVLDHSIETYESVGTCPETGETIHVQEVVERVVETVDPATVIAEKDAKIAELETKVAELEQIKAKYDEMIAEKEAVELADKKAKARAFAEKQGLDIEDTAVAEAIETLDYGKIAELSMAEESEAVKDEPAEQVITLASFVDMDVSDDKYGGLLNRKKK